MTPFLKLLATGRDKLPFSLVFIYQGLNIESQIRRSLNFIQHGTIRFNCSVNEIHGNDLQNIGIFCKSYIQNVPPCCYGTGDLNSPIERCFSAGAVFRPAAKALLDIFISCVSSQIPSKILVYQRPSSAGLPLHVFPLSSSILLFDLAL